MINKSLVFQIVIAFLTVQFFSGCAKYYYTDKNTIIKDQITYEKIPVKVNLEVKGSSVILNPSKKSLYEDINEILSDNPLFIEQENSEYIMNIEIQHTDDNPGAELLGAVITGLSLYIIPSTGSSDVDININIDDIATSYYSEQMIAQGLIGPAFVDNEKFTEGNSSNVFKNILKDAIEKFTNVYIASMNK